MAGTPVASWPEVWIVDAFLRRPPSLEVELSQRGVAARVLEGELIGALPDTVPRGALFFGDAASLENYALGWLVGLMLRDGKQPILWGATPEVTGFLERLTFGLCPVISLSGKASPRLAKAIAYQLVRREPGLKRKRRAPS